MSSPSAGQKAWFGHLMMAASVLVVCVAFPMVFIFSGHFAQWLRTAGIHPNPNLAGGYPITSCDRFTSRIAEGLSEQDARLFARALTARRFTVSKVEFRRFSGIGISPRLNLSFDFDGQLPDPQNSAGKFSLTTIHVYIRAPGRTSPSPQSDKAAQVDFGGAAWDYQVVIDGLHDQACIYDTRGALISRGLALYVDHEYEPENGGKGRERTVTGTKITAALPLSQLGDPAKGRWLYYVLVGIADSRHPSMMLHAGPGGSLIHYSLPSIGSRNGQMTATGRPLLTPIEVSNPGS